MPESAAVPPSQLVADLELNIGGRNLAVRLPMPTGPTNLRGLLPALRVLMGGLTGVAVDLAATEEREVSCRAGCGACCRQLVPLAGAEAHQLAALIETLPVERKTAVLERFAAARTQLAAAGLWDDLARLSEISDPKAAAILGLDYFAQHIACPFLEAEACSIHPERPLVCREYLVSSDPLRCADPGGQGVIPIRLDRRLASAVARTGNDRPHYVPMIAALDWISRNPETPASLDAASILGEVLTHLTGTEVSAVEPGL